MSIVVDHRVTGSYRRVASDTRSSRRGTRRSPALPDVYLIGAPKCGTTSVAQWLGSHGDVHVSVPKEPFHWASDYPRLRRHHGFESREAYDALFVGPEATRATHRVDASTVYLYSTTAVPDILEATPDARFIVAVRDPVELIISYHRTQLVALNEDEPDFARAWARSLAGGMPDTRPLDPKLVDYPRVAMLGAAVDRLLAAVGRERVHVLTLDGLKADPLGVWTALTGFLDLTATPQPDFAVHNVSAKSAKYPGARRLTHRPPPVLAGPVRRLRQWSRTTRLPLVKRVKGRMWQPADRPEVPPEVRADLAAYLRADVDRLGMLLGLDVSGWASP
jgi:hypothetical protein